MSTKIGITGHRYLENPGKAAAEIAAALDRIMNGQDSSLFEAWSCIALGSDTIFAEEALKRNITLHTIIPFAPSEYRKDFEKKSEADAQVFDRLAQHNPVIMFDGVPASDDQKKTWYLKAGEELVKNCDILLAVWDGREYTEKGGTADIVRYAHEQGKQVIHIKAYKNDLKKRYAEKSRKARKHKKIYERFWLAGMLLSLAAAEILAYSLSIACPEQEHPLAIAELSCVIALIFIIIIIRRFKLKTRRIQSRRETERYRVLKDYYHGDLLIEDIGTDNNFSEDFKKTEKRYIDVKCSAPNLLDCVNALLGLVKKQVKYHKEDRPELKTRFFHFLERSKLWLLLLFIAGVIAHFFNVDHKASAFFSMPHIPHWIGLFFPLAIPPLYAAIESYVHFKEFHKIKYDSEKMLGFFSSIQPKLEELVKKIETTPETADNYQTVIGEAGQALNGYASAIRNNMDAETKELVIFINIKDTPGV